MNMGYRLRLKICILAVAVCGVAGEGTAQGTVPGLVVPVPSDSAVRIVSDSFGTSGGGMRQFDVYRPVDAGGDLPVVVFANGSGAALRTFPGYVDWARLVTGRQMAAVLYEGPTIGVETTFEALVREGLADLDSVVTTLARRSATLGLDASNVVIWAGSGQTTIGTPFALGGRHASIRGYVLYYGAGNVESPRLDVPVFIARAGLDAVGLNRSLDSLAHRLTAAGVPLTLVNYPAGQHAFDIYDDTEATARVIDQTVDFMHAVTRPGLRDAVASGIPAVRAAMAFARKNPSSRSAAWRLGLAQLANNHPAEALTSFDRARELGQGGGHRSSCGARGGSRRGANPCNRLAGVGSAQFPADPGGDPGGRRTGSAPRGSPSSRRLAVHDRRSLHRSRPVCRWAPGDEMRRTHVR
jgi:acetyl esterase/lipase